MILLPTWLKKIETFWKELLPLLAPHYLPISVFKHISRLLTCPQRWTLCVSRANPSTCVAGAPSTTLSSFSLTQASTQTVVSPNYQKKKKQARKKRTLLLTLTPPAGTTPFLYSSVLITPPKSGVYLLSLVTLFPFFFKPIPVRLCPTTPL